MEVIARKPMRWLTIQIWIVGFAILGLGALFGLFLYGSIVTAIRGEDPWGFILASLLFGGFFFYLLFFMAWDLYHDRITPNDLIAFDGERLNFANKVVCRPEEIEKIRYEVLRRDYKKVAYGKLLITVQGKEYKFNNIMRLGYVTKRLQEIVIEAKEQNNG